MVLTAILAFGMAFAWMMLANDVSLRGFGVGYVFGFAIIVLVRVNTSSEEERQAAQTAYQLHDIPGTIINLVLYTIILTRQLIVAGVDVGFRALMPNMRLKPGLHCIPVQEDDNKSKTLAALSAHSITITPGTLVVDYDDCGDDTMLIHTLNTEHWSYQSLVDDQTQRVRYIKGILGYD